MIQTYERWSNKLLRRCSLVMHGLNRGCFAHERECVFSSTSGCVTGVQVYPAGVDARVRVCLLCNGSPAGCPRAFTCWVLTPLTCAAHTLALCSQNKKKSMKKQKWSRREWFDPSPRSSRRIHRFCLTETWREQYRPQTL